MSTAREFDFRPPYSIAGEDGKAIDSLRHSALELSITALNLDLRSLATDVLTVTQVGGVPPDHQQTVSVWDADGRRVFTGICTFVDELWDGKNLRTVATISGPWWWLEQVQLTSIVADDAGTEQERPIYTFASVDLAVSIRALVDRMTEMGVPLVTGEIDPTFQVPQMQFQNGTGESILTTMLQWLPDAATSIRYDVNGLPQLDVIRRPTAPIVSLDLTAATNRAGIPRISELRGMTPSQVKVQTMEVNAAGLVIYGEDVAGDPNPTTPLGRQILALSGPGRSDFQTYAPRVTAIQTVAATVADLSAIWALAKIHDAVISGAETSEGNVVWTSYTDRGGSPSLPRGITGLPAYEITAGEVYEWVTVELGVTPTEKRISGWIFGTYPSSGWVGATNALRENGRCYSGFTGTYYEMAIFVDFTLKCLTASYPALTVFVHPEDQALVTPVPSLASNLFAAQNYTPFSGSVPLWPGAPLPLPGNRVNVSGGLPKWTGMGAMTSGFSIDLVTGSADCALGRSTRGGSAALVNQFSRPLSGKIVKA